MANPNIGFGFRALTNPSGTAAQCNKYTASTAAAIYPGEWVCLDAGIAKVATSTLVSAGKLLGVASNYIPTTATGTGKDLWVFDDPNQEFECRHDGTSTQVAATGTVGWMFAITSEPSYADVNTTTLQADAKIDTSTGTSGVTFTAPFVFKRFSDEPGQDNTASYPLGVFKVHASHHIFGSGS